ncbi:class I SAM-dependent methyltransferase [Legionella yabuuchiae]|uniref:class I SAM-dependent methyltransferase n=1 Tax=Legionella yabuuchiae TaxID=376727 RepID=UPI001055EE7B|nr:class I SAM-dependent methyltransferase [Legionella yabuuchiae]
MFINYKAYSNMLSEQVDMCFPFEKAFYQKLNLDAMSKIVEIGSGSGEYLIKVCGSFPRPVYEGYDICKDLLDMSVSKEKENLKFKLGSVNDLESDYDLIILRLIVHQLEDREAFFFNLAEKTNDQTELVIIEPYDDLFYLSKDLPAFNEHLIKHRDVLSPSTARRNVNDYLEYELKEHGFALKERQYYYVPSLLPNYKEKYYRYMLATCQITNCSDEVIYEINKWYEDPDSFVQIGLVYFNFIKKGAHDV